MKEKVKYILGHVGLIALLILVIAGACWIVNYEGDRIDEAKAHRQKLIDDWEAKKADTSYYEVYRIKDSLSVYFMDEWAKVKNTKDFKGCKYVHYSYNSRQDSNGVYIGGESFIYLECQSHRALPKNIGTFKLRRIEPDRGENELMSAMYLTDWAMPQKDTVETLVIQNGQKLPESEARKIAQDLAKSMGLIQ